MAWPFEVQLREAFSQVTLGHHGVPQRFEYGMNPMSGGTDAEAKNASRKPVDDDREHRSIDGITVRICVQEIYWGMIYFDDLEDSRYSSGVVLISESASSLAYTKAGRVSVVGSDVVDTSLNGPEAWYLEPLGLDS